MSIERIQCPKCKTWRMVGATQHGCQPCKNKYTIVYTIQTDECIFTQHDLDKTQQGGEK